MRSYQKLREHRLAMATRAFNARGTAQSRCQRCLLADFACICKYRLTTSSHLDVILIMHRDEILKPTNSGRLINDILPKHSQVFEWSRTEPDNELLALLNDPSRMCILLFPADDSRPCLQTVEKVASDQKITLVVLDGTWRQARRMFRQSRWLSHLPCLDLSIDQNTAYKLRTPADPSQLSTAQACAAALTQLGDAATGEQLARYFNVFNENYSASKYNVVAPLGPDHVLLSHQINQQSKEVS
ncbi:tRNA-uridine aminocarboxypropyltransferase [Gayadomonas joobiniege]|uniref:tRNA-uridine aminocarboxypropyltransferase n=1 Tax=Gayadomonas joobiniege TaxID=1234606 RepID=UPI000373B771|nr:DTW domain-containing protein [Gayadomonas joobiniege]